LTEILNIEGFIIPISNKNKIYWPGLNFSKEDLIKYYIKTGNYIIPHIAQRPLSLHRFPKGINNPGFYQKNLSHLNCPGWVTRQKIKSKLDNKITEYAVGSNLKNLVYLANLGTIEFHCWNSTIAHLNFPNYCIIDLDPVEIEFKEVISTAIVIRQLLSYLGLHAFCKTTGGRGLHIYVRLDGKKNYSGIQTLCLQLVQCIHKKLPTETSLERNPKKRKGKIYLDYLQNNFAQTVIAPYSLRANEIASVATPLGWEELNPKLKPEQFTIQTIPVRLNSRGEVWKNYFEPISNIDYKTLQKKMKRL
jgi:bifunctional non-homologous end joining protein LigD